MDWIELIDIQGNAVIPICQASTLSSSSWTSSMTG